MPQQVQIGPCSPPTGLSRPCNNHTFLIKQGHSGMTWGLLSFSGAAELRCPSFSGRIYW